MKYYKSRLTLIQNKESWLGFSVLSKKMNNLVQVEEAIKYCIQNVIEGEKIPVRIDFVVPKIDPEDTCQFAEDFAELYEQDQEEKRIAKEEKEKAKQKKIARDKKLREQKKMEKEGN